MVCRLSMFSTVFLCGFIISCVLCGRISEALSPSPSPSTSPSPSPSPAPLVGISIVERERRTRNPDEQQQQEEQCNQKDLEALMQFKLNLNVNGNGSNHLNWEKNNRNCCSWEGVTCDVEKRVTKLGLAGKGMKGPLSSSLGDLDHLKELNVSFNSLNGQVPGRMFLLQNLQVLDLSFNNLSTIDPLSGGQQPLKSILSLNISSNSFRGQLPNLGIALNLTHLNVSNNSFTGPIPVNICKYSTKLVFLDFSLNEFNGTLGQGLGECKELKEFNAGFNSLSGLLPNDLDGMSSLEKLLLPFNRFTGTLKPEIGKLSNLSILSLYGNEFTGPLPRELGILEKLEQLRLNSNRFSGTVPSLLTRCKELRVLNLKNNTLRGEISLDFASFPELVYLDLASNEFSGNIPSSLWSCQKIQSVSLARNKFVGELPPGMGSLQALSFFSISNNSLINITSALIILQDCQNLSTLIMSKNFHGDTIPNQIRGFRMLRILGLGYCDLSGQVPGWLQNCPHLQVLDLSWNRLTGGIPVWLNTLQYLFYMDISNNSLSGPIPRQLTQLPSFLFKRNPPRPDQTSFEPPLFVKHSRNASGLQYNQLSNLPPALYLGRNNLNGSLRPEIGQMTILQILDLSHNHLSGAIPETLANLTNLETLDLSDNSLVGIIPPSLKELTFLAKFNVANNHLHGSIPYAHQFDTFPKSSFEGNSGLCGPPLTQTCNHLPMPTLPVDPTIRSLRMRMLDRNTILGITVSIGIGIAFIGAALFWGLRRHDLTQRVEDEREIDMSQRFSDTLGSTLVMLFQNHSCKDLSIVGLLKATDNFDQANIIGCGGFGLVYRATLADGTKIAVKKLTGECGQMEREFRAEVEALSRAQHKNLVSLQGYCNYGNDRLLIYSYMENGSLDYWLHERLDGGTVLDWSTRLKIAQGAGRGLAYLHRVCEPHIVHRDIKSSNILLDDKFEAHLADFGLSRLILPCDTHVSTELVGTLGYIPPEYGQSWQATRKGDVYSFGVVILELLTRKRPVDVCKPTEFRDLVAWVRQLISAGKHEEIFDPFMRYKGHEEQMLQVLDVACMCINQNPLKRPTIQVVVSWLEKVGLDGQDIKIYPVNDDCCES